MLEAAEPGAPARPTSIGQRIHQTASTARAARIEANAERLMQQVADALQAKAGEGNGVKECTVRNNRDFAPDEDEYQCLLTKLATEDLELTRRVVHHCVAEVRPDCKANWSSRGGCFTDYRCRVKLASSSAPLAAPLV